MCWVLPGFLDAKANCFCCVSVLMQVDLPALERPTKAISGTSSSGRKCSWGAVVRNLAVWSHPNATVAGDFSPGLDAAAMGGLEGGFVLLVIKLEVKPEAPL